MAVKHWLTYHWAHPVPDDLPWHIYRKNLNKRDDEVAIGDRVLFFQGARRQTHAARVQWGKRKEVPLIDVKPGIVCVGTVSGQRRRIATADVVYDYGNLSSWQYVTPCEPEKWGGPVVYRQVQRVLRSRRPAYTYGLVFLEPEQFAELEALLIRSG